MICSKNYYTQTSGVLWFVLLNPFYQRQKNTGKALHMVSLDWSASSCFTLYVKKKIPQSWPFQDLLSRNVLGLAMLMFSTQRRYHHDLRSTDGLTVLPRIEIVAILVDYQPSYNTSHTMLTSQSEFKKYYLALWTR